MNRSLSIARSPIWCVSLLLLAMPFAEASSASELEGRPAVRAAAKGLRDAAHFPWYDSDTDQLRPVPVTRYQPPLQSSNWEWQKTNSPRSNLRWLWRLLQYLVWGFLALVLFLILFFLLRNVAQRYLQQDLDEADERARRKTEADRIENLPFQVKRPQTDLLGEALRHYRQGNYGEAIIYLFSYQLVQLDKNHFIRLTKGKTNRQYLGELRPTTPLRRMLSQSMSAFEDVFFGHYGLSREQFEACWNRLDEFHRLVQQSSGTA